MDVVADLRARGRRALDLTDDPAVLTAIANDIGVEAIFSRQVIAHGRAGDTLLTLSTSGSSANVIAALAEARRRGLVTIAMVGYDGGRIASESLADHVVIVRSEHIPRIQEAQASAYHTLVELLCECGRGSPASCRAWASGRSCTGSRPSSGLSGFVLNDSRGRGRRGRGRVGRALPGAAARGGAAAGVDRGADVRAGAGAWASRGSRSGTASAAGPTPRSRRTRRRATPAWPSCSTRPTAATATRSSTAPTAARGSRSSPASRTTGRTRRWPASSCAPACQAEYDDPSRPPLPRPAERVPGVRAARVDAGGSRSPRGRCSTARSWRSRAIGGYHLACRADDEDGRRAAARAQAPRGPAVRADGARRRGGTRAGRARDDAGRSARPRGRSCSRRAARTRASRRRSRRARATSA